MGILSKAKDKLKSSGKSFGDETVFYDEDEEQPRPKPKKKLKIAEDLEDDDTFDQPDLSEFFDDEPEEEDEPAPSVQNDRTTDILEFLQIEPTFEIEADIFMPGDIPNASNMFDVQAPKGYEMGEVEHFVDRVKVSIQRYVDLLKKRNEHVAMLATVIDRLQVDAHNLKWQMEEANGINIIPTNDTAEIEDLLMKARVEITELKKQLANKPRQDNLSSEERKKFETLQDEVAELIRENEHKDTEIYALKNRVAQLEEEVDNYEIGPAVSAKESKFGSHFKNEIVDEGEDDIYNPFVDGQSGKKPAALPPRKPASGGGSSGTSKALPPRKPSATGGKSAQQSEAPKKKSTSLAGLGKPGAGAKKKPDLNSSVIDMMDDMDEDDIDVSLNALRPKGNTKKHSIILDEDDDDFSNLLNSDWS